MLYNMEASGQRHGGCDRYRDYLSYSPTAGMTCVRFEIVGGVSKPQDSIEVCRQMCPLSSAKIPSRWRRILSKAYMSGANGNIDPIFGSGD